MCNVLMEVYLWVGMYLRTCEGTRPVDGVVAVVVAARAAESVVVALPAPNRPPPISFISYQIYINI